ncbi:MAG: PEP-CTERM sorting domain-containing protein [Akkermansiaceae bacterium]|nr:PEP-CTERM sorting domain-containing protein [Akkermansiaceae bacterium]
MQNKLNKLTMAAAALALTLGAAHAATLDLGTQVFSTTQSLNDEYFVGTGGDTSTTWTINSGVTVTFGDTSLGGIFLDGETLTISGPGTLIGTISDTRGIRFTNGDNQHGIVNVTGGATVEFNGLNVRIYAKNPGSWTGMSGTLNIEQGSSFKAAGTYNSGTGKFTSYNTNEVVPIDVAVYGAGTLVATTNGDFVTFTVAVPEPSSAALLGLGGLALILRRRK